MGAGLLFAAALPAAAVEGAADSRIIGNLPLPEGLELATGYAMVTLMETGEGSELEGLVPVLDQVELSDTGSFELELPTTAALLAEAEENEAIDVEIAAVAEAVDGVMLTGLHHLTAWPTSTGGWFIEDRAPSTGLLPLSSDERLDVVTNDFSGLQLDVLINTEVAEPLLGPVGEPGDVAYDAPDLDARHDDYTTDAAGCIIYEDIVRQETPYIIVGEMHASGDTPHHNFRYGRTADSDLGIGYSNNNTNWRISTTKHIGTTNSGDIYHLGGSYTAREIKTQFLYQKRQTRRFCPGMDGQFTYRIYATRWNGGLVFGANKGQYDTRDARNLAAARGYNTQYGPNTGFSKNSTSAVNFTTGVNVMGVQLSARSGLSTRVRYSWQFGGLPAHHLFYHNAPPTISDMVHAYTAT